MLVTGSSPAKSSLAIAWLVFAGVNTYLTFVLAGEETIPYHLVWASFALLYGLYSWSRRVTWVTFGLITATSGIALVDHARSGVIGWSEVSEVVLMGAILSLLIWHVDRHRAIQRRLVELQEDERRTAAQRELASRFGTHEVRTRLAIARGFVELMASATTDPGMVQDAELVLGELDKASGLVTSLLTLVRVGTPSPRAPVDVATMIASIVHRWVGTADREWTSTSFPGFINGDAERFEASFDCLIENAVKFTVEGDSIDINARIDGPDLVLSVEDSGAGIPAEDFDRIFDIFQTSTTAGDRAGNGLGLSIVKAMVDARHGTVEVSSAVGVGSCFTLRIPLSGGVFNVVSGADTGTSPAAVGGPLLRQSSNS